MPPCSAREARPRSMPEPAVSAVVGVDQRLVGPVPGHAHHVVVPDHGRHVAHDDHGPVAVHPVALEDEHGLLGVAAVDPGEARLLAVARVQRALRAVGPVEVAHEPAHALVVLVAQQVPVERDVVVPLALLRELAAHEEELLARMRPHEPVVGAQVRELLPAVTGHLADHRSLAVHHLVVAQRQDEVLREGVDRAEGHLVVVVAPIDGVLVHVLEGVVHPPHVPLEVEAQPPVGHGTRDAGPGGGLLGHGGRARHPGGLLVGGAQEGDGVEVLAPAVAIGNPLSRLARVVEVEHGGHRIHAQRVHVILLEPERPRRAQEVRDLGAAEVVDQRVPVAVEPQARVLMLVERRAVEAREPVRVGREVRRHPVHDDAQARPVQPVHEGREAVGVAVARGRREEPDGLVAPGARERVLRDGQQLDMSEAHVGGVVREQLGDGRIVEHLAVPAPAPGAQVDLVDRDGRTLEVGLGAAADPGLVGPAVPRQAVDDRRRAGRGLLAKRERVGLERQQLAIGAHDLELVGVPRGEPGDEELPEPCAEALAHDVAPPVPGVEVAHHGDAARVGRPDGEGDAVRVAVVHGVRAEPAPELLVTALGDEVFVHLAQHGLEGVGVLALPGVVARLEAQAVGEAPAADPPGEEALRVVALQRDLGLARGVDHHDLARVGGEHADDLRLAVGMHPQHGEGVAVLAAQDGVDLGLRRQQRVGGGLGLDHRSPSPRAGASVASSPSRMDTSPASGTPTQSGRKAIS